MRKKSKRKSQRRRRDRSRSREAVLLYEIIKEDFIGGSPLPALRGLIQELEAEMTELNYIKLLFEKLQEVMQLKLEFLVEDACPNLHYYEELASRATRPSDVDINRLLKCFRWLQTEIETTLVARGEAFRKLVQLSPDKFAGEQKEFVEKLPLRLFLIALSSEERIMNFLEGLERLMAEDPRRRWVEEERQIANMTKTIRNLVRSDSVYYEEDEEDCSYDEHEDKFDKETAHSETEDEPVKKKKKKRRRRPFDFEDQEDSAQEVQFRFEEEWLEGLEGELAKLRSRI